MIRSVFRSKDFLTFAALTLIGGLVYLPFVYQFGYFNDDWYLMYAAGAKGGMVFRDIYSVDRPLRALVMGSAYTLFGANPLWYNLSAFLFRLLSAFGLVRLSAILWPGRRVAGALMGLLFLIYPGFLSQFNGIDYQSQMVSLAAAVLSLVLTLEAVRSQNSFAKILLFLLSGLLAMLYIGLVEYFIGFELIRVACIFILALREKKPFWRSIVWTLRLWLPVVVFLIPFMAWRLFFFESERTATDVGQQLGTVLQSPLTTSLRWLLTLFSDSIDVTVLAWGQPLSSLLPWIGTRNLLLLGFGVSTVSAAIVLFLLKQVQSTAESEADLWPVEAFWLGLSSIIAGLLPVVLVNRYVDFTSYSRYALASSAGVAVLLASIIFSLKHMGWQNALITMLVFVAALTHFANAQSGVQITQATRNFWWQVSWRIPQLEKDTTLVVNYAVGATEEDYFVWGPASLIYYPDGTRDEFVQPGVYAALLNQDTLNKTLLNQGNEFDNRRTIRTYKNYRKLLVLTQPTENSCVHAIDGGQQEYSRGENASVRIIGPYSSLEHIRTNEPATTPPLLVFGPEPEHNWCYYYQKADLARQRNDWEEIQSLGNEALGSHLRPGDPIEWMPFLQAYAQQGDVSRLKELAPRVMADPYIAQQACYALAGRPDLAQPVMDVIETNYCID